MKSPIISVIMATYNHADYVEQAIDSVLLQQGVDFEFLITDDGSTDRTSEIVASIHDKRVSFFPNKVNRGACVVTNELIGKASGEFIALINSDDFWIGNDKLACQLQVMKEKPSVGACFGRALFVDKNGNSIDMSKLPNGNVFAQKNRSRGAWLRHFFDLGNCICHPTMLIRKRCYKTFGMYDNRLRQLPDFDMWVRLLKGFDINVIEKEMIAFRYLPGKNVSSATIVNFRRLLNESYFILKRFFDGVPRDVFFEGFRDLLVEPNAPDDAYIDIEKALIYLSKTRWSSHLYNLIGLEKLHHLMGSDKHRHILIDRYGIDDCSFQSLSAEIGVFDLADSSGSLSIVNGLSLIAEVERRVLLRTPSILRPVLNSILKRFERYGRICLPD